MVDLRYSLCFVFRLMVRFALQLRADEEERESRRERRERRAKERVDERDVVSKKS